MSGKTEPFPIFAEGLDKKFECKAVSGISAKQTSLKTFCKKTICDSYKV